jgi:hypothetical protein
MSVELVLIKTPTESDREAIQHPLIAYNVAKAGPVNYQTLAIALRDAMGATIGGLWGHCYYEWLFIELLFVPEHLRLQRYGTQVMTEAEMFARYHCCTGVWLDSFAFQAPRFLREARLRTVRQY